MTVLDAKLHSALGDFSLNVAVAASESSVTGLFGASGSGKTTVLRCIAGLHRAHGSVHVNGDVWQDDERGIFVPTHSRRVGYISQDADLFPHLSVRQNLAYAYRRVGAAHRTLAWDDVVDWLAVGPLLDRNTSTLSGGERQRVAIARALLRSPTLLLMDEPVSSLDEPARREVLGYLSSVLARLSLSVLYVSHSLSEVARLSDQLVWLVDGRVGDAGPVSQVMGRSDFARWRDEEMGVVLEGTIVNHDDEFHLSTIRTPLGDFAIHRRPEPPNTRLRVQVNARDVSLGLVAQEQSSILNELQLTVLEIVEHSPSDCLVRLGRASHDEPVLLARITRKSRQQLQLEPTQTVYARVKSVAVLD